MAERDSDVPVAREAAEMGSIDGGSNLAQAAPMHVGIRALLVTAFLADLTGCSSDQRGGTGVDGGDPGTMANGGSAAGGAMSSAGGTSGHASSSGGASGGATSHPAGGGGAAASGGSPSGTGGRSSDGNGGAIPGNGGAPAPEDAGPLPSLDFDARCKADGVLLCRGFDSDAELAPTTSETETGAETDSSGSRAHMTIDTSVKASGKGSLRFEIVGKTGANHSGAFRQLMGRSFGAHSTFYAQFKLRLSPSFIDTDWDKVVGSAPKIVIFHNSSATCNDVEWTQVMSGWHGHIAEMYTHCGMYAPEPTLPDGTILLESGDYRCAYGSDYAKNPECLKYTPDEWMTFYFKGAVGDFGQPNSTLQAWISVKGRPYEQWIDSPDFTLYAEGDSVGGFDSVYLTTYMTNKNSAADHPTAYAWYDELVVSTAPIAVPAVSP